MITNVQKKAFAEEIKCLEEQKELLKSSPLFKLSPILDSEGLIRVEGRIDYSTKNDTPLTLPGTHHVSSLIVKQSHDEVKHQGTHESDPLST